MSNRFLRQQFAARVRPKLSHWKQRTRLSFPRYRRALRTLGEAALANERSEVNNQALRTAIAVRRFVNEHSVHLIDAEHDQYAFNVARVIALMKDHLEGRFHPPHLSCGPRAYLMKEIGDALGMRSRIIDIFEIASTSPLHVNPHTLLEVYDPVNDQWHMQDPDFNVQYVHRTTKAPLSASTALHIESDLIGYETNGGEVENALNLTNTIDRLFDRAVLYRYSYEGKASGLECAGRCPNVPSDELDYSFQDFLCARDPSLRLSLGRHSPNQPLKGSVN